MIGRKILVFTVILVFLLSSFRYKSGYNNWLSSIYSKSSTIVNKTCIKPFHVKTTKKPKGENTFGSCTLTASIAGNVCLGSTLTLTTNSLPVSITWIKNGTTPVATQTSSNVQNTPVVVAGGNGVGANANQLNGPDRFFVDAAGNIYIPEIGNSRVQKWAPGATSGVTVAGGNGTGSAANQLDRPAAVWVDALGNVYIADQSNNRIQKWAPGATSGTTVISGLAYPTGLFMDASGNMYISEQFGDVVVKYAPGSLTGTVIAGVYPFWGTTANRTASPTGIYVDASGNLYECDADIGRVQKWAPGATSGVTVAGSVYSSTLVTPLDVYGDSSGALYVTDYGSGTVQKWIQGATFGTIIASGYTPAGVWVDANNVLYVSDFNGGRVLKYPNTYTATYTPTSPGDYTAKVVDANGCTVISNTITIVQPQSPSVSITANTTLSCANYPAVFTATPVNGGASPLYQWKVNGVNTGTSSNTATFSNGGLKPGDVISCTITSNYTCLNTATATSNAITVTAPTQTPVVRIASSDTSICMGANETFTATPTNGGTAPAYQWLVNGNIAGSGNPFIASGLSNGDIVTCNMLSNATTCQVTSTATSNAITVKVNPVLIPSIVIKSDLSTIYSGSKVTFTAIEKNGGTNPVYTWQINGNIVGANSSTYVTNQLTNGDTVSCILTSSAQCVTGTNVKSNVIPIKITIVAKIKPPNTFTPNNDGVNDTWKIPGLVSYPQCVVNIYNRYGQTVFKSVGYTQEWDGKYNGKLLNVGTYYYVIKLDDSKILSGDITIMR